jgi:hypothetical protein
MHGFLKRNYDSSWIRWVFGKFMGTSDLRERNSLAYREAWPACLERGIYVACRCRAVEFREYVARELLQFRESRVKSSRVRCGRSDSMLRSDTLLTAGS